jgi:hypothetical protein
MVVIFIRGVVTERITAVMLARRVAQQPQELGSEVAA